MIEPSNGIMLKPGKLHLHPVALLALFAISMMACNSASHNVPFPAAESEFAQPITRPLQVPEATDIKWTTSNLNETVSISTKRFDFDALPSKPFDIGASEQFRIVNEIEFDLDSMPKVPFDESKLPVQNLRILTRLLGNPTIEKGATARIVPGASRGVMQLMSYDGMTINANCFLQDREGLFWLGTDKGLIRYDGENTTTYSTDEGLFNSFIYSIYEDSKGNFWLATQSGLFVIDWKAGTIQQLTTNLEPNAVISIIGEKDGEVWASHVSDGVVIYDLERKTVRVLNAKYGLADNNAFRICQDNKNRVWVGTNNGISMIDRGAGTITNIKIPNFQFSFISDIIQDEMERIWVGSVTGVFILDINRKKILQFQADQLPGFQETPGNQSGINCLLRDKKGNTWMGTDRGLLYSLNLANMQVKQYKIPTAADVFNLNLFETNDGVIWSANITNGCYMVDPTSGMPANLTTRDGLGNNSVWSILEDTKGLVWIGTRDGIDVYNPEKKTIKHISKSQGLPDAFNTKLFLDSAGRIWSGGFGNGVSIIDIKNGTIQQLTGTGKFLSAGASDFLDADGEIWMGTANGAIEVINLQTNSTRTFALAKITPANRVSCMVKDSTGRIWVGCRQSGVYVIDKERKKITHFRDANGLSGNIIAPMMIDSHNHAWIGSQKGLDMIDQEKNTITTFTASEGLASSDVWTLNEWNGKYYVGTTRGLTVLTPGTSDNGTPSTWTARSYGKDQGFQYTDFASNSSFVYNNQLWAGVENQILTIIDEPIVDSTTSPVFITRINILDKPQFFTDDAATIDKLNTIDTIWKNEKDSFYTDKRLPADTGYLQKNNIEWDGVTGPYQLPINLQLPYHQNYLSFSFSGLHLHNTDKVKYRYIMEGIDKNWSPISDKPSSENYRDLPPGKYTFKVASKGLNNIWSEPASFSFTIAPPWWRTWWAYLIYTVAFLLLLGVYIRRRSYALQKENQFLEEKVMNRTNELRKSLNDLRETQNQLIQSEKMASLGELTAGIAHEIQNPLNFVNNFSEVSVELANELQDEINGSPLTDQQKSELNELLDDIVQNQQKINYHGKRADSIVKGMLQHSRTSKGIKEPTNINTICDEYLRLAYHGLRAKDKTFNATMKTDFDENVGTVDVVPQDFGRVILNLVTNAFYAATHRTDMVSVNGSDTDFQPTVWLSTKKENGFITITVKDNGAGIPKDIQDKIFQPFFTTKPTGQGTGLGLSMTYEIITKGHGGELNMKSLEGEGTEFTILLPLTNNVSV